MENIKFRAQLQPSSSFSACLSPSTSFISTRSADECKQIVVTKTDITRGRSINDFEGAKAFLLGSYIELKADETSLM